MSEEVRVILVGEKWEAKEKMSDNLMFKMKASESLKSQGEEMAKLLGRPDLGGLEFFKGKGKPPAVTPGVKLNLSKVASDVATKAGSIVIYVKEKEKKEKTAAPPSNNVKLLLCGDDWKAKTKLSDNLMADIKKDQTLESSLPDILKLLKLSSLEGYHLCKGRGKAPEITAGTTMDLARTPESLNLQAAAFVYVKKVKKADAAKPKEVRQAIYQLGSLVDLQDEDTDEWTGGQVTVLHNDGSYDVSLVSGAVVRFVDADDLRVSTTQAAKAPAKEVSKEQQLEALKTLSGEFPSKSVPEIGGLLKSNNFDVEGTRSLLKASMPAAPVEKKTRRRRDDDEDDFNPLKPYKVKLDGKEELGIEYFSQSGKVLITKVSGGACGRAGVPTGLLVRVGGERVDCKEDLIKAVTTIRKEGIQQFDLEMDTREAAAVYIGCIVDASVGADEWERGTVIAIHPDGEDLTFDVKLEADGEIEDDLSFGDLQLISDAQLKEEHDSRARSNSNSSSNTSFFSQAKAEGKKVISGGPDPNDPNNPTDTPPNLMPDHSGVMRKKGNDMIGLYKNRKFALYGTALYYYKMDSNTPMGVLDLRQSLAMDDLAKGREYFGIGGRNLERVYHFICGSEEEKTEWMDKLKAAGVMVKPST